MKIVKVIISVFWLAFVSNSFAQEIQEKKEIVDSLFKLVKKITPAEGKEVYAKKLTIKDNDLEKAKKMLYEAYAYAPIEFEKKLHQWTQAWGSTGILGVKEPDGTRPGRRLWKLKESIAEKYGWDYVWFLETPYVLKVEILDKDTSLYEGYNKDKKFRLRQVDLKVKILEVIKGEKIFQKDEEITISYLPIWYLECDCPVDFKEGSTYLIPVKPWYYRDNKGPKKLLIKNNGMKHFYEIKNNIVTRPFVNNDNFTKQWPLFKKDFINKYLIKEEN